MAEILCLSYSPETPHHEVLDSISNVNLQDHFIQSDWNDDLINDPTFAPNYFTRFHHLISYLFIKGNDEHDANHPTLVVIDTAKNIVSDSSKLDLLRFEDKSLLLKYFFNHLNVIVIDLASLAASPHAVSHLNTCIDKINSLIRHRISRVQTWTGTGPKNINDYFSSDDPLLDLPESDSDSIPDSSADISQINFKIDEIISTMSFVLGHNLNTGAVSKSRIIKLKTLIMAEVDFKSLLSKNSDYHLSKLCHLVGHWSFPSHELSNDDLVYCVYLMIRYSLDQLRSDHSQYPPNFYFPNENELLGFVFMVRDTYKNGNPFHNFRHAVDVLQACFHYVIRLNCLPQFKQYETNPKSDELAYINDEKPILKQSVLVPRPMPPSSASSPASSAASRHSDIDKVVDNDDENGPFHYHHPSQTNSTPSTNDSNTSRRSSGASFASTTTQKTTTTTTTFRHDNGKPLSIKASSSIKIDESEAHLTPLQTLGLLIAALGHDVGHPGVTNAFMIQYDSPTSLLYNERSVLESFHSSVFINKILTVNWPGLLDVETDPEAKLTFKQLIISCILATDMAEHFEYIDKLTTFKLDSRNNGNKVKLIMSLLIKCADISNVTRPLRVSSQWASVLSREFNEVNVLQQRIDNWQEEDENEDEDVSYNHVPVQLDDVLEESPMLYKGQLFFINTFAENLFNNIVDLLPELTYTCDIIKENKRFWTSQAENESD